MKKISYKMISLIVPLFIIALLAVSNVAVAIAKTELLEEMNNDMQANISSVENEINSLLSEPENITKTLAKDVGGVSDPGENLSYFNDSVCDLVEESDYIVAIGFFMDPVAWTGHDLVAAEDTEATDADETEATEEATDTEETEATEEATDTEETEVAEEATDTEETEAAEEATDTEETEAAEEATDTEETEAAEEATDAITTEAQLEAYVDSIGADSMINYYWAETDGVASFVDIGQDTDLRATEWWSALEENGGVYYTETYVDTTLGILMTSFVVPIYDNDGNFIGCLNTDINMSAVQNVVNDLTIGDTGHCMLVTKEGLYLTGASEDMILNEENTIANDTDTGLGAHAEEIMSNESYQCTSSGAFGSFYTYTKMFDSYDWILIINIEESEVTAPISKLTLYVVILSVIALMICMILITLLASTISKPIKKVQALAEAMASGDYSMEPLAIKGKDEVAVMTQSLNDMLEANRKEMSDISGNSNVVSTNSETLQNAVKELEFSFKEISESITNISNSMMDNNATTEELTASVTEVKDAVANLAEKAKESETMSSEIMERAQRINKESTESFDNAMTLTKQYEAQLNSSIENSKVVEEIGIMADAINDIASQINLLSLNASIEAARAGEAGRGFAVVATEIGNLASQTSTTVANIQETIVKVKAAVSSLADNSGQIISFINESVTPDYKGFVDVSVQYEDDAVSIKELAEYVSGIAGTLSHTMNEFNEAIQNIADMSQNTTESAAAVLEHVDIVSDNVENVDNISKDQLGVAQELDEVVARYKF